MKPRVHKDHDGLWCVEYKSPQNGVTRYRFQRWSAAIWWVCRITQAGWK